MKAPIPKCPKCEGTELVSLPVKPRGSSITVGSVCCAKCGSILGFQELISIAYRVSELEEYRKPARSQKSPAERGVAPRDANGVIKRVRD